MPKFKYDAVSMLRTLGITHDDSVALRRISLTLHRWHEHECNGTIQRHEESGLAYWHNMMTGKRICRARDMESGAINRLGAILARYPELGSYVQGDPRGASLYIIRPGDILPGQSVDSYYSRGIAVY